MKTFTAGQFKNEKFFTADMKERFSNHFVKFVESGFKRELFYQWFYERLTNLFGMIAHHNREGFYETFFTTAARQLRFVDALVEWGYKDDLEGILTAWLLTSRIPAQIERLRDLDEEAQERAMLAYLLQKYDGKPVSPELLPDEEQLPPALL
ncbi:MAG: hypothetical protein XU15_C0011G0070 [candidate division NC10 bacterium CSP1-5]|nr:MAG: hypothetical protein XU15_C0011G0070 [candidate division NC10 bacterium CSP1-5]